MKTKKKLKLRKKSLLQPGKDVLGVCGGNGVILYALKDRLVANCEPRKLFHSKGQEQWKANFGDIPLYDTYEKLPKIEPGKLKVIIGAPDCGHSSQLCYAMSKKLFNPKDNQSLNFFIHCVQKYQPEIFVMENLPKMLTAMTEEDWKAALPNYKFVMHDGPCSDYGNSQMTRRRLLMIGTREYTPKFKKIFSNVHRIKEPKKVKHFEKVYRELKETGISGCLTEPLDKVVSMKYKDKKLNLKQVKKIWNTLYKEYSMWQMPESKMKTLPGVYRLKPDAWPRTVMKELRQFDTKGRVMSPRQLALYQGIPNDFVLYHEEGKEQYWINKQRVTVAKTPPHEMAAWFRKQLTRYEKWQNSK